MVTPFHSNGAIDYAALPPLVEFYIGHGAAGLFACCWSSESQYFTPEETVEVCRRTLAAARGRAQVAGGVLIADSEEAHIELIRALGRIGLDAVVLTTDQVLGDCSDADFVPRFERLLRAVPADVPLGIYECPGPYHRRLRAEQLGWLAETGRFVFHKDTACDMEAIRAKLACIQGTSLRFFNAHTPTLMASLRAGGDGYCGIGSNFWPEVYSWVCGGGYESPQAAAVNVFLIEQEPKVGVGYPINAKRFLAKRGVPIQPHVRIGRSPDEVNERLLAEMQASLREVRAICKGKRACAELVS